MAFDDDKKLELNVEAGQESADVFVNKVDTRNRPLQYVQFKSSSFDEWIVITILARRGVP